MRHEAGGLTTNVTLTAGNSLSQRLAFPGLGQARIEGRDWSAEAVVNWGADGPLRAVGGASRNASRPAPIHRLVADQRTRPLRGLPERQRAVRRAQCDDPSRDRRDRRHPLSAGPAEPKRRIDHPNGASRSSSTGHSVPGSRNCRSPTTSLRRCAPECWCSGRITRAARRFASTSPGPTISKPKRCGTMNCSHGRG